MSKIPAINEIDANSPSQESTEVVVKATTVTPDINEIQETISASATIQEIDGTRKPTISEIYKIVNDGLFESTTNWWDYAYKLSQAQINQDIISRLDNGVIGGGYSKGVDIITTTSNKVPSNTNVYSALKSDSLYPKKLNDEVINGIYDFLNGLTIGKPTAYTGGTWSVDQTGRTHLTTDYLYVRLKAIFETLQILNVDTIGGKLVISPAGSIRVAYVDRIKIDAPVFTHNEETDVWSISQVEDDEGNLVNETLNQEVYRCYFLGEQDGEEVENKWKVGDQAQAKTFNVKKGTYHKVENSYLWRLVVNVSSDTVDIDGKKYHYVDLSQIDFDSGSDAPAPGDILNQLGHRLNDTQRQTALVLNAVDNYAPSITLYAGVNYYTLLNKEYVEFGVYNGKAFFNVYGDMYIGDKGENPKTYIKYKNGKINIKANLEIGSSIGDKDLDQYIKDNVGIDENKVLDIINNSQVIKDLQKQTDGAIETWFYEGVPTLKNLPAVDWNTSELKKIHIGDLYYDQITGYAYRFTKYNDDVNPYRWNRIKDNDIVSALDAANRAQATADAKMKVFYGETKPTNYQVGDMWVNATLEGKFNNDIARAVADNKTSFNADDWVLASRYSEAIATIQKWTNEYETKFGNLADEVKQQKDQSIVVWYLEYEPTIDNVPANKWNTETLRSEHIGDIVYDIKNNHSYRWTGSAWVQIKDADFNEAMKAAKAADDKAGAAGDLADSKRRIFYSATTPTKPFDKGDLWIKQVGDKTETWVYNGTDWVKSDDKDLAKFTETVNKELTGIKGQLDGKAETWYQVDNPSIDWTDKTSHKGDIWYNTKDGTTNYWNGSAWEQMDIPKDVFDTIDGKSSIFVDSYADAKAGTGVICKGYKERDLWILPANATINGVEYYKGDMLTAVSNNKNFDESNWKKKVRYIGPTELNKAIDVVNDKINTINNTTIPGINNKFNEFIKDGVLDSSEKARLTDLLNQASNEVAAVVDQVNNITTSKYLTNDNANKGKLKEANTVMNTAWTEYKNLINTLVNANTEITKLNIGEANTKYKNLQEKIKAVKQYLAICQADILSGMGTDITSYKYLKDALNQTTEINGGLVLTSAIQLKDVDKKVTAGMNGIVKGDKTSIAAWYGGPMIDRDTFTSEELKTKVPGTDYAMSLLRHDGTGYLAGGNIHWNTDGVLSGNFNSFILQGTSMVTMFYYIKLFYLHAANQDTTDFNNIDYVTPMKTFSRLSVLPLGGVEGGNNLPTGLFIGDSKTGGSFQIGNIILRTKSGDPNILEIVSADSKKTAHLGVQGGVSAYGTYTPSTGGGGGLNGTIVPYATAITSDPQNEGSKIASASSIYKLHSRISSIENNGATSITVTGTGNAITSVVKNGTSITFTKGATFLTSHQSLANCVQTVTTTGTGNAVTAISKSGSTISVTKGATFLTSHQSLANYYTKSSVDSLLSGKSATSHTHSVKINGVTKTIAATGGTAVDLGTYLTSHQSLADYAKKSEIPTKVSQLTNDTGYITSSGSCAYATSAGNADKVDGVHVTWAGRLTSTNNLVAWEADGSALRNINPANVTVGNSDKLDGVHANGLLTALSNSNKGISITVGGTTKSISNISVNYASSAGNADTVDGYHASHLMVKRGRLGAYNIDKETTFGTRDIQPESEVTISGKRPFNGWGTLLVIGSIDGSSNHQLAFTGDNRMFIRCAYATTNNYNTKDWATVALTSDNVASATKLQTPRTIWGQSFDGTGNVNGTLTITDSGSDDPHIISTVNKRFHIVSKYKLVLYAGEYNSSQIDAINILSNHNVGIGVDPAYKLHVAGDIYSSATIRSKGQNKAIILSNDVGPAWISALEGQVIFNTGKAIRFGETAWDWSEWAGLKYNHSNKTIYLGIADGSAFNANSPQSDGTLRLASIKTVTPDSGARIGGSGGNLYLGNANNSGYVYVQDMCSQASSAYWKITQSGNASFKSLNVDNAIACGSMTINGDTHINSLLTARATMFTTSDSNVYGTSLQNWDGSIGANVTNMFNGIDMDNIQVEYSIDNGASWNTYPGNPESKFNLVNDNVDIFYYYLGCNNLLGNTDADKLAQIKKNQLRVTVKVPNEAYQELSWISVDVDNGVNIKCQVYFGNSSGAYTEYTSKVINGWSHKCDICVGPLNVNVGNNTYRYVRLVFSHPSNNTNLRNGIVTRIRALALTKYAFNDGRYTITATGHIYNYDAYMNTYFPNSILAKGGVTAYQSSDIRLKQDLRKLDYLGIIKAMGGTYGFAWKKDNTRSIGWIAQHVLCNPHLKDIVETDEKGYYKINYWSPKLIATAFGAIEQVDDEIAKLKARVRELENEVEQLKSDRL